MTPRSIVVASALVALLPSLPCRADANTRLAAATNQLARLARDLTGRCLADVSSADDWLRQREARRRELLSMLGLDPMPARTPLAAEVTGVVDRPEFQIEKLVFQSRPGLYVTGNFYVPRDAPWPAPTVLYLCGHSPHPFGAKTQYQNRTLWYATHGYCVLALDTLEFAEVPGVHHGTHDLGRWDWISRGYTPAGVEVWNGIRALDWLETRREVDARRLGVTGISGGGAITWYLAAVDTRVAVAAPSCSTFTYGSQATHWLARGQCDCIYYGNNTADWDFPVVAALIAPRPLLITSGQRDTIFPPDGYHEVYRRAKRVYDLLEGGDSQRIRELDAEVGHSDPPLFLNASRQWMNQWLKNQPDPIAEEDPLPDSLEADALVCLTAYPKDAINARIDREFIPTPNFDVPASRGAWRERRSAILRGLGMQVFGSFPTNPVPLDATVATNVGGWIRRYADCASVTIQSEVGVRIQGDLYSPRTSGDAKRPLLVTLRSPGERFYPMDVDALLPLLGRCHIFVLSPRFTETTLSFGDYTDIERTAAWTGRSIATMQVWDVLRAIDYLLVERDLSPSRVTLHGRGDQASVALYAALLNEQVNQVILESPPPSHRQGAAFPNILRITDLPEAAAVLAPRRLAFIETVPPEFALTRDLYRLAGNPDALRPVGCLADAVLP